MSDNILLFINLILTEHGKEYMTNSWIEDVFFNTLLVYYNYYMSKDSILPYI